MSTDQVTWVTAGASTPPVATRCQPKITLVIRPAQDQCRVAGSGGRCGVGERGGPQRARPGPQGAAEEQFFGYPAARRDEHDQRG